jgi:uncharacterized protein YllA (UPF0747 family)
MFDANDVVFPILIIRNSVQIFEKNNLEKFLNLGFEMKDIFDETPTLQKKYLKANTLEITFKNELVGLQNLFSQLKEKAVAIDKTLESTVDAEFAKLATSVKNIEQKILKAQKRNEETSLNQIEKFKSKYFPHDVLQERNDNFLYYFSKYGMEFIQLLLSELKPLNNQFLVTIID